MSEKAQENEQTAHFGPYSFDLSNPEKILFPEDKITKGQLIDYYHTVARFFISHAKNHPLAMHRFPDGINQQGFFQKEVPDYFPNWIDRVEIARKNEPPIDMVTVNKQATLIYLANQACIAPHLLLSSKENPENPDKLIFDLDPPEGRFDLVISAARALRKLIEENLGLKAFVMTTGSSGLHVVAPIKPVNDFEKIRQLARETCEELANKEGELYTTEVRKNKRKGRLFLDYLRNSYGQHSIAPYAVRALPGAPVATPLKWSELDKLTEGSRSFDISNIRQRLKKSGDPWKSIRRYARTIEI